MPTEPIMELLPRNQEPEVQKVLDKLADSLEEVLNFGTHVFQWHNEASAGGGDEVAAVQCLFRHFLGMIDTVSVLVRHGMTETAPVNMRSAFESVLSLEWIFQNDSHRRSMAFLVWHTKERLKLYKKLDRSTSDGQNYAKKLENTFYDNIDLTKKFKLPAAQANLEQLLQRSQYIEAALEYEVVKKSSRRNPAWYSLFNGPPTIEKLAERLDMTDLYEVLYRKWSGVTHSTDVIVGRLNIENGYTTISQLRNPLGIEEIYSLAIAFALRIYRHIMKKYDSSKLVIAEEWYIREIRPVYTQVSVKPIIVAG